MECVDTWSKSEQGVRRIWEMPNLRTHKKMFIGTILSVTNYSIYVETQWQKDWTCEHCMYSARIWLFCCCCCSNSLITYPKCTSKGGVFSQCDMVTESTTQYGQIHIWDLLPQDEKSTKKKSASQCLTIVSPRLKNEKLLTSENQGLETESIEFWNKKEKMKSC